MIVHCAPPLHQPAPATAGAPARRLPLYLFGRSKTSVGVDGPALLVRHAGKSPARYPLARISRVISGAGVEWTAAALATCLAHELPIVFLDGVGEPALSGLAGGRLYESAVHAYVLEHIQRAGLCVLYWAQHGQPLRLAADLADLLSFALMLELRGLASAVRGDDAALLRVLHSYSHGLSMHCAQIFARLHRHLSEVLNEWH